MSCASTPSSQLPMSIAVIGLGHRSRSLAINLLSEQKSCWNLTAVCEQNEDVLKEFQQSYPAVACFRSVEMLILYLKEGGSLQEQCAYVAVPHSEYSIIVPLLLQARIHVLKEKPAAMAPTELDHFQDLASTNAVRLLTASQTRYSRRTAEVKRLLPSIGNLRYVTYSRTIPVQGLGDGWRASRGAGVLGDLGWHVLDFVTNVVDSDQDPEIGYTDLFITRPAEGHDCEDTAHVVLKYKKLDAFGTDTVVTCNLKISRVGPEKQDEIVFTGENGVLHVKDNKVVLATQVPPHKEALQLPPLKEGDVQETFRAFQSEVLEGPSPLFKRYALQDRTVTKIVQGVYDAFQKKSGIFFDSQLALEGLDKRDNGLADLDFEWPIISSDVEGAVVDQLHTSLSIYGNGGVFAVFEEEFKAMHQAPDHYSLLHNSGTNALQALYFGAKLLPGDEVIFPVYTFHATCSPAMHFGIQPVFCDALPTGNISPEAVALAITPKTKAVVVTHMWGQPANMIAIKDILKNHPGVLLFEDCSHAHGARIGDRMVGTFGDGAAWSLQGQKLVTGGEGGILMTKHADIYHRALTWGHYNKRCKVEIPKEHSLRRYFLTGAGLKHRAHPLAVAIALNQLLKLPAYHKKKTEYAKMMAIKMGSIPFLEQPQPTAFNGDGDSPAWYAYVMRFKKEHAPKNLTREMFVAELHHRGLKEADIPRSTGLLHEEPLFTDPAGILPHMYNSSEYQGPRIIGDVKEAQAFYDEAIKLPVFAEGNDLPKVIAYMTTIISTAMDFMLSKERGVKRSISVMDKARL